MSPRHIAMAVTTLLVAACQGMPTLPVISPYRMDIQQGNVVTQEMVAKLRTGMTRSQVRYVLGTPLLTDVFHPDRWDYVYRFEKAGTLVEHRSIVAIFKDDKLLRIDGDVVAASAATGKPAAAQAQSKEAKPAAAPVEKK